MQIRRQLSTSITYEQNRSSTEHDYKETNDFGKIFLNSVSTFFKQQTTQTSTDYFFHDMKH